MSYDSALAFLCSTEDIGRSLARKVLAGCRAGHFHVSRHGWCLKYNETAKAYYRA